MTRSAVLIFGGFSRRSGHGGASLASCAVWLSLLMAGCATDGHDDGAWKGLFKGSGKHETVVSEAQACAIGYDLARAIHDTVSLRRTVIVAPTRSNSCERHALNYLRLAGFRIDRSAGIDPVSAGGPARDAGTDRSAGPDLRRVPRRYQTRSSAGGVTLDIELTRFSGGFAAGDSGGSPAGHNGGSLAGQGDTVTAVARLGRDLTIVRSYRPAHSGVVAVGPVSIQHLNPDTYTRRTGGGAS